MNLCHSICVSTYQKVPVVGRLDFGLQEYVVQSQNISQYGPIVNFEVSPILPTPSSVAGGTFMIEFVPYAMQTLPLQRPTHQRFAVFCLCSRCTSDVHF